MGHHRMAAGDVQSGAHAILDAVELLVQWGYSDLAHDEITAVEAAAPGVTIEARASLHAGRILDQMAMFGRRPSAL